ncbi:MAG: PadR family transcriptional regulator [Bacteroides sp.]|nr:PadR family transcriptional regulator [Roseburia sp.]MCM1463546.1 PadR family transcriptional regulator [Bacteroides sp.]
MLKHGILGLLGYGDMTGYEIMEVFRDSLNYFWDAKTSQIYRELRGLEERGWVAKTVVPQRGKPDKNVYAITPSGRAELLRWLADGDPGLRTNTPILMKVFFLGEQSAAENIRYFEGVIERCEAFLRAVEAVPRAIEAYGGVIGRNGRDEKSRYWEMTLDYGRRNARTQIEWARECIRRIEGEAE